MQVIHAGVQLGACIRHNRVCLRDFVLRSLATTGWRVLLVLRQRLPRPTQMQMVLWLMGWERRTSGHNASKGWHGKKKTTENLNKLLIRHFFLRLNECAYLTDNSTNSVQNWWFLNTHLIKRLRNPPILLNEYQTVWLRFPTLPRFSPFFNSTDVEWGFSKIRISLVKTSAENTLRGEGGSIVLKCFADQEAFFQQTRPSKKKKQSLPQDLYNETQGRIFTWYVQRSCKGLLYPTDLSYLVYSVPKFQSKCCV